MLVRESECGGVTFARLLRDGLVTPVLPDVALPRDVPDSPGIREFALLPFLPNHAVLSGLAGLWVHGIGHPPGPLLLVGARGSHRRSTVLIHARHPLRWHAGAAYAETLSRAPLRRVAPAARCAADALRWEIADDAAGQVAKAIDAGVFSATQLDAVITSDSPRGRGYRDMVAARGVSLVPDSSVDARW